MSEATDLLDETAKVVFSTPPHGAVAEYNIVDALMEYMEATAAFLVATMIDAHRAASTIFGWDEPAELQRLWDRAHANRQPAAT